MGGRGIETICVETRSNEDKILTIYNTVFIFIITSPEALYKKKYFRCSFYRFQQLSWKVFRLLIDFGTSFTHSQISSFYPLETILFIRNNTKSNESKSGVRGRVIIETFTVGIMTMTSFVSPRPREMFWVGVLVVINWRDNKRIFWDHISE